MMHWLIMVFVFFMLFFGSAGTPFDNSILFAEEINKAEKAYIIDNMPSHAREKYFGWLREGDSHMNSVKKSFSAVDGKFYVKYGYEKHAQIQISYAQRCYERANLLLMSYRKCEDKE